MPPQNDWSVVGAVLWLIMSLAIVLGIAWLTLRFMSTRSGGANSAGSIKVLDRVIVGKDQTILIIKCGGRVQVVAFTNGGATVLSELTEEEQGKLNTPPPMADFSSILKKAITFGKSKKEDKRDGE